MTWIEMSRDEEHGGGSWGFTKSLWCPSRKANGARSAWWETVSQVAEGDTILHLRGIQESAAFLGYSVASSDGYVTTSRPPHPGQWADYTEYYRVYLDSFTPFVEPIALSHVFERKNSELRHYFQQKSNNEHLFYVIQNDQLQCQNGAYLSEASPELLAILLDEEEIVAATSETHGVSIGKKITTGTVIQQLKARVGQGEFSIAVRDNYSGVCCFPDCEIAEQDFLVGAHIARWSDRPDLRGDVSNGLCLCLLHDRAFEKGYFTIDFDFRVLSTTERIETSNWAKEHIEPYVGRSIRLGNIKPSEEALLEHWDRTELYPE